MLSTNHRHRFVIRNLGSPKTRFSNFFSQDFLMFLGTPSWIRTGSVPRTAADIGAFRSVWMMDLAGWVPFLYTGQNVGVARQFSKTSPRLLPSLGDPGPRPAAGANRCYHFPSALQRNSTCENHDRDVNIQRPTLVLERFENHGRRFTTQVNCSLIKPAAQF